MRAARLASTLIERICYDEDERSLSIWFRSTGRYIYYDVSETVYESLKAAGSAGRYFNERIKGRYRCTFDPERRRFRPTG
ncbi:MAG: KTSC domain-containing protein [Pseudomonadota bacterium]|nr:KTSC domain-containing protein [Pseudomonadota bacterium]